MMGKKKSVSTTPPAPAPKSVMETRVFKSGNSYAVRLPKSLYSAGADAMHIQKLEDGKILLTPKEKRRWPVGFFESFGALDGLAPPQRPAGDAARDTRDAGLFDDE